MCKVEPAAATLPVNVFSLIDFLRLLPSFDDIVPKMHYFIVLVVTLRHICVGKKQREDVIIKLVLNIRLETHCHIFVLLLF